MIPQNFEYSTPASLKEALTLLSNTDAKILAGGMSLIPMMKLRLATPERLVDLSRVPGLSGIAENAGSIHIGAMTTHHEIEDSPLLRARCPLLVSAKFDRTISLEDFLVDTMTTALEPGEILQEVIVPVEQAGVGVSYRKMAQPASGFAIVGVAARAGKGFARVGVTGLAGKAYRARNVEKVLLETGDIAKAAAVVGDGVDANSDLFASADYRTHMAQVYTARALKQALAGAS